MINRFIVTLVCGLSALAACSTVRGQGQPLPAVLFQAIDGQHGSELWISNGTAQGTYMLKDINPSSVSSNPNSFVQIGNSYYFTARTSANGRELWVTDGTASGTHIVKDIISGPKGSYPKHLTAYNGKLYFVADDGTVGRQLMKSDGTAAGTQIVANINPSVQQYRAIRNLVIYNGELYFSFYDSVAGYLWKTDGTMTGTTQINIQSLGLPCGYLGVLGGNLMVFNGALYYNTYYITYNDPNTIAALALCKTNGTVASTSLVASIATNAGLGLVTPSTSRLVLNGELYFPVYMADTGWELWKTNGTASGTQMVKELCSGSCSGAWSSGLASLNGDVYFGAMTALGQIPDLWKTDGTGSGTQMVKDFSPGGQGGIYPPSMTVFNGELYFAGGDTTTGFALWKTDGTTAGTTVVKNFNYSSNAFPLDMVVSGGVLYFSANDGTHGYELWKTDGTTAGTTLVKDINPVAGVGSHPRALFAIQ